MTMRPPHPPYNKGGIRGGWISRPRKVLYKYSLFLQEQKSADNNYFRN